jgi:aspartate kinase
MLSYDKMLQLIDSGAKVMCKNSILWAKQYQIRIFVGKVNALDSGTWIEG